MNRTQLLSLGSALGLTLKKSPSSAPVDVPNLKQQQQQHSGKGISIAKGLEIDDEIGPLTASPPASPATRISSSSASFFGSTTNNNNSSSHASNATRTASAKQLPLKDLNRIGSFATHNLPKLRESKWFKEAEARIFCVVAEIGFIVEIRRAVEAAATTKTTTKTTPENAKEYKSLFGVVTKKECINQSAEDKKLHVYKIEITTIDERKKLDKLKLTDVWATNNEIRINNFNDKNKQPHDPADILDKVLFARRSKNLSWHNTEHFSYWCRYGEKPVESVQRRRQVSECIRWGSHAGIGTGMLMLINRRKTTSK